MINSHFSNINGDTNNIFSLQILLSILDVHHLFQSIEILSKFMFLIFKLDHMLLF